MMKISRRASLGVLAACLVAGILVFGLSRGADADKAVHWVTLGTNSGPIPNPRRSEPANLLQASGKNILVDVGEGAPWQLAKAGVDIGDVDTIIISHLHFDHTSGLFAFLSLRYQGYHTSAVTIYGPPGTKRMVDALNAAMAPMNEMPGGMWAWIGTTPEKIVKVIELKDGSVFTVGDVRVSTVVNSHYTFEPGSKDAAKFLSFSYRFDTPLRSIVYTGDTGPSVAVEKLAQNADLLVSEIMDPDIALARIKEKRFVPFFVAGPIKEHFHKEHLSPTEVGLLASRANVKALVLTHDALPDEAIPNAGKQIAENYKGSVTFANDLDKF
ncbi:MAG: MBL fold metallo-hydrolase [Parvibaculaceae bacterium]